MIVQQSMLCGDEIKSAIVDLGTSNCRFGTAGQDVPRHVFRSEIGIISSEIADKKILFGDSGLRYLNESMEIHTIQHNSNHKLNDIEKLIKHGIEDCMRLDCKDTPLFLSQNSLVGYDRKSQENMMEICFESLGSPSLYLANSNMLSSFSAGKPCSLVIDIGANGTKISPIIDGYELRRSSIYTNRGGNMIDKLIYNELISNHSITNNMKLWFETDKYYNIHQQQYKITSSFRTMHTFDIIKDIKKWMSFIPHIPINIPYNDEIGKCSIDITNQNTITSYRMKELTKRGLYFPTPYELPDGALVHSNDRVCTTAEQVFFPMKYDDKALVYLLEHNRYDTKIEQYNDHMNNLDMISKKRNRNELDTNDHSPTPVVTSNDYEITNDLNNTTSNSNNCNTTTSNSNNNIDSLATLIYNCISSSDIDVRKELLSNIHIVGGGSLIEGMSQRLSYELNEILPTYLKVKLINSLPIEKLHAAWIGGSILGICGSFQQNWLLKSEYEEYGGLRCCDKFDH